MEEAFKRAEEAPSHLLDATSPSPSQAIAANLVRLRKIVEARASKFAAFAECSQPGSPAGCKKRSTR